jgi:hypothetical protein
VRTIPFAKSGNPFAPDRRVTVGVAQSGRFLAYGQTVALLSLSAHTRSPFGRGAQAPKLREVPEEWRRALPAGFGQERAVAVEREREGEGEGEGESDAGAADAWALPSRGAAAAEANARSGLGAAITTAVGRVGTALVGDRALPGRLSPEFARLLAGVRRASGRAFEDPVKRLAATLRRKCAPQATAALYPGRPGGRRPAVARPLSPADVATRPIVHSRPFGMAPLRGDCFQLTGHGLHYVYPAQFQCPREVSDSRFSL